MRLTDFADAITQVYIPRAQHFGAYPQALRNDLDASDFVQAYDEIVSWAGYQVTPVRPLNRLARQLGIGEIYYKDESARFGLGSFKALGGSYAVFRAVSETPTVSTFAAATDGNHGRAVAWAARACGRDCVIYIHQHVSLGRQMALENLGARVVRTSGNYDECVRCVTRDAVREGWVVIPDSSEGGYEATAKHVMAGYGVIGHEIVQATPQIHPTHLFVQAGVGALAAALGAYFWIEMAELRPNIVVVEPSNAACVLSSLRNGRLTAVGGDLDTVMAGLSCGRVSPIAWNILSTISCSAITMTDAPIAATMQMLNVGAFCDQPIVGGETGVAGLAGLICCASDSALRMDLGIDSTSRILCIGTEGSTDPKIYQAMIER